MDFIPSDPALKQFVSDEEFGTMEETFGNLASTAKNVTRLPNKPFDRTKILKAFEEAFELIGGVPRLAFWAHHNQTDFYKLYTKMMPASSQIEFAGKLETVIRPALPRSALDEETKNGSESEKSRALGWEPPDTRRAL